MGKGLVDFLKMTFVSNVMEAKLSDVRNQSHVVRVRNLGHVTKNRTQLR